MLGYGSSLLLILVSLGNRDGRIPQGCPLCMMFIVALYLPWWWASFVPRLIELITVRLVVGSVENQLYVWIKNALNITEVESICEQQQILVFGSVFVCHVV